ncbi:hypothetical protein BJ912DRAFT_1055593 [Pholiota molesta]|nr:hypothetical protein BJ912DRAFT_1055593 [Pholiota molesta]
MSFEILLDLTRSIIESIDPSDDLSDSILSKLQAVFSEGIIVAALDIIDQRNVIHFTTSWGHSEYEIMDSAGTNTIFLDIRTAKMPYCCSCPAFVSSVLISGAHIMCKHVLATMIARRTKLCIDRPTTADDLAAIYSRNLTLTDKDSDAE